VTNIVWAWLAGVLLAAAPHSATAACTAKELTPGWLWSYNGTLGEKDQIRLTLALAQGEFTGVYYHAAELKDIRIRGKALDGKRLELDELDGNGKVTAHFDAEFAEHDPRGQFPGALRCQIISGWWQRTGTAPKQPVYLSLESGNAGTLTHLYEAAGVQDDSLIHRTAFRFQEAVSKGDRSAVASMIDYPIRIHLAASVRVIHSSQELLAQYDAVFTPAYRKAIAAAFPRNMFVNDRGIMLGRGEVWFGPAGRVIMLNN
jgi:hypothetical protein